MCRRFSRATDFPDLPKAFRCIRCAVPVIWAFAAPCWMTLPARAEVVAICWVDHVAKAEGGLNVFFRRSAVLRVGGIGTGYTVAEGLVHDGSGHTQDHLFVRHGSEFYASQVADDSCSYKVDASEAVGKLTASSAMRLPGLEPVSMTEIIGTDGVVSKVGSSP